MALGPSSTLKASSVLQQLLEEINFQRTKEMRQLLKDDSGFVMLQGTTYWTDLFVRHFLFQTEQQSIIDCDDLLFFVRKKHVKGSSRYLPKFETEVDVFRKDSRKLPIGDPDIDWEETVYLNLVIHQFDYTLTLAICTRTSPKELQVLKRHSQKVYASPSRRKMDTKGEGEEMTYPHICFMVDNFDEVFCDILVRDGEMVCVELVARDRDGSVQGVIFLGSIRYDALKKVYDARQSSLSTKVAQRMTFGLFSNSAAQRCEFVRMKGPQGKGHAEMAVTKPRGSGVETPTSEPGYCHTDAWDDWDEDPEEMYNYRNQRRLSDPSANLNNFRGAWKAKPDTSGNKSRSENEGLDSLADGMSEIEAGDLRDDRPVSSSSCPQPAVSNSGCCCWRGGNTSRRGSATMSEVYCRACDNMDSPACLANVTPKKAKPTIPNLLSVESELEVPGKNGHKLKNIVNSAVKIKNDDKKGKNVVKNQSNRQSLNDDKLEIEIADDATSLNEENGTIEGEIKVGLLGDMNSEVVINGIEELPCVEHTLARNVSGNITKNKAGIKSNGKTKSNEITKKYELKTQTTVKLNNKIMQKKVPDPKPTTINGKYSNTNKVSKLKDNKINDLNKSKPSLQKDKIKISNKVVPNQNKMSSSIRDKNNSKRTEIKKVKDVEIKIQRNESNVCNGIDGENNILPNANESKSEAETETVDNVPSDNTTDKGNAELTGHNDAFVTTNSNANAEELQSNSNNINDPIVTNSSEIDNKENTHVLIGDSNPNPNSSELLSNLNMINGKPINRNRLSNSFELQGARSPGVGKNGERVYCTLPKRKRSSLHHSMWYREPLKVPMRTTPDGTDIYYWCDVPKKQTKELDDGAYNPLWAMRGFTQTFHFWKENKRQQSTPLNAFLTYVTLPWWSIAKDILDHREGPILTF